MVHIGREEPSFSSGVIIILWLVVKDEPQSSDPSPAMLPTCIMTARRTAGCDKAQSFLHLALYGRTFNRDCFEMQSRIRLLTSYRSEIS